MLKSHAVKHFTVELRIQIEKTGLSIPQFAKVCGLSTGQLYLLTGDRYTHLTAETFAQLCEGFGDQPAVHGRLLVAHLMDEKHPPAGHLVEITLKGKQSLKETQFKSPFEIAIDFFRQDADSEMRETLVMIAATWGCETLCRIPELYNFNSTLTAPSVLNDAEPSAAKPSPIGEILDQVVPDLAAQVSKSPVSKAVKKSSLSKSSGK